MPFRVAYMPLSAYPLSLPDSAILAAAGFVAALGLELHVTAYSVDFPETSSTLGAVLLDLPGLVRAAEEKTKAECQRVQAMLQESNGLRRIVHFATRQVAPGTAPNVAAGEARYHDLSVIPWTGDSVLSHEMAEAIIFGSGRPAILVPSVAQLTRLDCIAIAWDASRVAARALGDALTLLPEGGRISVLTVEDDKPQNGYDVAGALASTLERRGFKAEPRRISLGGKTISEALQDTARAEGAQLLAMGGFGHSRVRDFLLGGATKGILSDLRLPTLLSH